ncbi:predicted protein [Sclerotinia sclerotiorum 1980 UF-70]|uniref:Uncharacterized protein n=1 Tax=Sclerotinia sclerotiorum (strain ATCC 18683 / 1980 / Ss-1) TaxID=665079 RepID=A7EFK3_SCLS1|nr:predicted protein [Sclerotinia sclerotiorum 1980 UF-70]EDO01619.1 predicted protein [Sclerotinia sclerotiorum 1980 UF-70]
MPEATRLDYIRNFSSPVVQRYNNKRPSPASSITQMLRLYKSHLSASAGKGYLMTGKSRGGIYTSSTPFGS